MKIRREVKIGLIVITGVMIALFGINYLKGSSLITNHRKFYAVYPRVDGLKATNPILINGLKIGQVSSIKLMDDNRVLVILSIDDKGLRVSKGSIAKIISSDILGSKAVELIPTLSRLEHQKGDTLRSEIEVGLKDMIVEQVDPIKAKFITLMGSVDTLLTTVNQVLDEQAVNDLNQTIGGIRGAILTLEQTAVKLDRLVASQSHNIGRTLENTAEISEALAKSGGKIDRIISNFSNISDTLAKANLAATLNKANVTMNNVNQIVEDVNSGKGSLGLLMKSDSLHNELVSTTRALEALFLDIQANPKRYVSFSLIGKSDKTMLTKDEQTRLKQFINSGTK